MYQRLLDRSLQPAHARVSSLSAKAQGMCAGLPADSAGPDYCSCIDVHVGRRICVVRYMQTTNGSWLARQEKRTRLSAEVYQHLRMCLSASACHLQQTSAACMPWGHAPAHSGPKAALVNAVAHPAGTMVRAPELHYRCRCQLHAFCGCLASGSTSHLCWYAIDQQLLCPLLKLRCLVWLHRCVAARQLTLPCQLLRQPLNIAQIQHMDVRWHTHECSRHQSDCDALRACIMCERHELPGQNGELADCLLHTVVCPQCIRCCSLTTH